MKIPLKFVQLHTPAFHCGTNLSDKIDYTKRNIGLTFDDDKDRLEISFNGHYSFLPSSNVALMLPIDPSLAGFEMSPSFYQVQQALKQAQANVSGVPIKAQVEVPHEKVQNPPSRRSVHS